MWKWVTFFLLFSGMTSVSLAEEKRSYQTAALSGNEETVWSNELESGSDMHEPEEKDFNMATSRACQSKL